MGVDVTWLNWENAWIEKWVEFNGKNKGPWVFFMKINTFVKIYLIDAISLSVSNRSEICTTPLIMSSFSLFLFSRCRTRLFFYYSFVNRLTSNLSTLLQTIIILSTHISGVQNSRGTKLPFTVTVSICLKFL